MSERLILVVDDDFETRNYLKALLEAKGYQVSAVETGGQALLKMRNALVDLVILDVLLPDGTGLDFCRQIKEMNPNLPVPVVMLSAVFDDAIVKHAVKRGADDYMTKPPVPDRLLGRVEGLLNDFEARVTGEQKAAPAS